MLSIRPEGVPLGVWRRCMWITLSVLSSQIYPGVNAEFSYEAITAVLARITISYVNPISKEPRSVTAEIGRFADGTIGTAGGVLINPKPNNFTSLSHYLQGCHPNWATPLQSEPWIALLLRGGCSDAEKVKIALAQNASAILLFGGDNETYLQKGAKFDGNAIVVYLLRQKGEQLSYLVTNGTKVLLAITRGQEVKFRITSINRTSSKSYFNSYNPLCAQMKSLTDCAILTSVLFVSVSFIVLMVVSLAWLIFYYIQRFRYINAKDKLARHLCTVAKKALAKVPVKNLKNNDKEIDEGDCCAICIEQYQVSEAIRTLPCKHQFHKICVDPWLLEHRTCPMCKMDILKYYGYVSNSDQGSEPRSVTRSEASNVEAGLGTHREPSNSSSNGVHGNPQVSVISHSEIPTSRETFDRPSSNPVGDGPLPHIRPPTSGFGATTQAVIRSMINSARPRVVPISRPSNTREANDIEESPKNKEVNRISETLSSYGELAEASDSASVSTDISSSGSQVEEQLRVEENYNCNSPTSECSPEPSSFPSQAIGPDKVNDSDIDHLVQEIMEIDYECDSSCKSVSKSPTGNRSFDTDSGPEHVVISPRVSLPPIKMNPQSNCPVGQQSMIGELPTIECDSQNAFTLSGPDPSRSRRQSTVVPSSAVKKSSLPELDNSLSSISGEMRRASISGGGSRSTSSLENRRPSSHMVTISHS